MRVIAGFLRSRTLQAPAGLATRPTSDRLRETLFNVLGGRVQGAVFLDLYAGSGAVGIEALSRGARRVEFVEQSSAALKVLRANLARLDLNAGFGIHAASVRAFLGRTAGAAAGPRDRGEREPADLVFLDPPYDATAEYAATMGLLGAAASGLLAAGALVVAEHRRSTGGKRFLEDRHGRLERVRLLEQGDAALSFYAASAVG
ncbi:MAG: 16S rRNA (guanine(966)-N(2))-methyltransferase RsmD [Terracidiphilus sp.]